MQIPEAAPPANKKRRQSQIDTYNLMRDRISELPDDLLIRIVSILNLEESAITSTLSRRWKHLWRSCNRSFNFDGLERMNDIYRGGESLTLKEETCKFVRRVDPVLNSYEGILVELRIAFDFDISSQHLINKWIINKRIKSLELDFRSLRNIMDNREKKIYFYCGFPQECFSSIGIKFLTSLCFKCLTITDENLENLLSNCLMLERLHVVDSPRLVNVKLCNSRLRLKYFHILGCERLESLEVFAPNLVYFEYGIGLKVALNIRHAPQLRNVSAFGTNTLVMLQNHLFQLVSLTLSINKWEESMLPRFTPLTNLRDLTYDLTIGFFSTDRSILQYKSLIEASPFLHKFKLKLTIHKRGNNQMMEWMMGWGENNDDNYRHQHLKEVEILGFQAFELDTEFVSWLLKSAVKLENLVIQTRNPDCQKRHVRHWLEDDQKRARKVAHLLAERWHPGVESMIL